MKDAPAISKVSIPLWRLCLLLFLPVLGRSVQAQSPFPPVWDTYSDIWVATDALGRALPDVQTVGPPHANKTLGMFYFLAFERGGEKLYDNTKILQAHPEAMRDIHHPAWGPLNSVHYWGEPLFGYYASDDPWVLRKHAQMLANAGVDVVVFDNSNAVTYAHARRTLCQVWEQIREQGGRTPQIAFLCPFGNLQNDGTNTLCELYDTLYEPGRYADLWFRWNGKPLVLADPVYASTEAIRQQSALEVARRQPVELDPAETLGQTFTAARSFSAVGGEFPTWGTTASGMTLSLYVGGPGGKLKARRKLAKAQDNAIALLEASHALPPGKYYLEMSHPVGHIGWWTYAGSAQNGAYEGKEPATGVRSVWVRYANQAPDPPLQALTSAQPLRTPAQVEERARKIREFFTFRTPIASYDDTHPPPGAWAWLQIYPQAVQRSPAGKIEQITVGVAQNYNATTQGAPMSFPGAFGRSYHQGKLETSPNAVRQGYNFAEQWKRALAIQPPFVFVTGWNEWTAGFATEWAGYKGPPPIFVDEFNQEFSRDIEPMRGGHGDDYYYQLVSNARRYKGVRVLPPVTPFPTTALSSLSVANRFGRWKRVTPEFRDAIGDTAHRNAAGFGQAGPYVNTTGRNDIVAAKVSYDARNLFFYVRTREKLTPRSDPDWMLLYINADADYHTGWLGYDFVVNRSVGKQRTSLERCVGNRYQWQSVAQVKYVVHGSEMEITIPRSALGITHLPATLDFKWADHCYARGDWTDFTLNGDAAPDDRFNYRAKLEHAP